MKKIFTNLTLVLAFFLVMNVNVNAQIVNIPDANFKAALVANTLINTNQDGEIQVSEATAYTGLIDVNNRIIHDLTGIEAFTNITGLNCSYNFLTNLNLYQNTALTSLDCSFNNSLHYFDLILNTNLVSLNCGYDSLYSLDVTHNPSLTDLECGNNLISSIDLSFNAALNSLGCGHNSLSILDVTNNNVLDHLSCFNNYLAALDVTFNYSLTYLYCDDNPLHTLDVTQNNNLKTLVCVNTSLSSLDVTNNLVLTALVDSVNFITSLDVSQNTALTDLICDNNPLSSLDLSQNTALSQFTCSNTLLSSLDLSHNPALTWLDCNNNSSLSSLNVADGNNINFLHFYATNNPNLSCIQVDNVPWSTTHWTVGGGNIDNIVSFSLNCACLPIVYIPDPVFKAYLLGNLSINTNSDGEIQVCEAAAYTGTIDVSGLGISDLTGIEAFTGLTILECYDNSLNSMDLHLNTALWYLDCHHNSLNSLNVTQNILLNTIDCDSNSISNLDVNQNTVLNYLYCNNNSISSLNLNNNTALVSLRCNLNQISNLDISQNTSLYHLECNNNALISLNAANGNNSNFAVFDATSNSYLTCIQVDNIVWSTTNWTVPNNIDFYASFSLNCANAYIFTQPGNQIGCVGNSISILVSATGVGLTYQWRKGTTNLINGGNISGATSATITFNPVDLTDDGTNYNAIVSASNSSQDSSIYVSITVYPALVVTLIPTQATCAGNDGTISTTVTGGSGTYYYSWSNGSTNSNLINLSPGIYTVTISDGFTCSQTVSDTITSPALQIVNIPDAVFKANLVAYSQINTNGDGEIQVCEAIAYTGGINVSNSSIFDLTGIEAFINLTGLACFNDSISNIDISHNTALQYLWCEQNFLTSLDVSQNLALIHLYCYNNLISSLDVSHNLLLTQFECNNNFISSLDISHNTAINDFYCSYNSLDILNIANGNNINFTGFGATINPNLVCIQVDDVAWSTTNWTAPVYIDNTASFSLNCPLITGNVSLNTESVNISIYPNPASSTITIHQSTPSPNQQLLITNILGEEIYHQAINNSTQTTIDVSQWSNGVYFYQIRGDKETLLGRFVKQ